MRIAIFGATGGTGKNVVDRVLSTGHDAVAAARRPEAVAPRDHLEVRKADVLDAASLEGALVGVDAVICVIGPASNSKPGTLISEGTKNLVAACEKAGVRRFVFESGMIMSDGSELTFLGRSAVSLFGMIFPKLKADKFLAEATITASGLDWVIVRPPALDHSAATGKFVAGPKVAVMAAKSLSHADCAEALVRAATEPDWVKQVVNLGWP